MNKQHAYIPLRTLVNKTSLLDVLDSLTALCEERGKSAEYDHRTDREHQYKEAAKAIRLAATTIQNLRHRKEEK